MIILGIDPGKSGGLAWVGTDGYSSAIKLKGLTDLDQIILIRESLRPDFAYIEKVQVIPKNGSKSNWALGFSYGSLRMALTAAGIPYEAVAPGVWQRPFSLPTWKTAGSDTAKKNAHKARAQELFPGLKITHATADALLIAEWGRRQRATTETP